MITLLVMTDGRKNCLLRTVEQARKNLYGAISVRVIHDDSGDDAYAAWLNQTYCPQGWVVHSTGQRSGFGGAVRSAWSWLREHDRNPLIFHLEDDFLVSSVNVDRMAWCLDANPRLVQLALLRQAWSNEEKQAGGIIEKDPDAYTYRQEEMFRWVEHRRFFTTNPSLYRRSLILDREWPEGDHSEGRFGIELFESDPQLKSAFWTHGQMCEHIGDERVGTGY